METTKTSQAGINSAKLTDWINIEIQNSLNKPPKVTCPKCKEEASNKHEEIYIQLYKMCYTCDTLIGESDEIARYDADDLQEVI